MPTYRRLDAARKRQPPPFRPIFTCVGGTTLLTRRVALPLFIYPVTTILHLTCRVVQLFRAAVGATANLRRSAVRRCQAFSYSTTNS